METVHVDNGGCFQALSPYAYFVKVRLGRSVQRLRERRGVAQLARFQGSSPISAKITAFNCGFELRSCKLYFQNLSKKELIKL